MKTPEIATPVETTGNLIALRRKLSSSQDVNEYVKGIQAFVDFILANKLSHGLDFESGSFLFDEKGAELVRANFEVDDVTDLYRELKERTSGFRIVLVGSPRIERIGDLSHTNRATIIKDYHTGTMHVYDEYGRPEGIIPKEAASVAFSTSRFEIALEEPLKFFDTLEEALGSRKS